jgi:predicted amidohydrolase
MKIALAQTRHLAGNTVANLANHKKLIALAVASQADIIVFPELSLTGYEPALAKELATDMNDKRFDDLQVLSNLHSITIIAGMPIRNGKAVSIGMIIFIPRSERQLYLKKYLHRDEEPYFIPGINELVVLGNEHEVSLSICYELSIPQHAKDAARAGANVYLSSSAKTAAGVVKAEQTLGEIARTYGMTVFFSNCVGHCDNFEAAGKSAIWNSRGEKIAQLDEMSEGILMMDTQTNEIIKKIAGLTRSESYSSSSDSA